LPGGIMDEISFMIPASSNIGGQYQKL